MNVSMESVFKNIFATLEQKLDGETKLASSISDIEINDVKVFGPLIVLHHIAEEIGLPDLLGDYSPEILSLVYAHCLNYQSINHM